jgi:molybdopterin converting factor subunit 1
MNISILLFASLKQRFQRDTIDLEISEGTRVGDIFGMITKNCEEAEALAKCTLCAINENHVSKNTLLQDGDTVALLPPMSGG